MSQNVRVRFAPSPTGPLHIGGLRTALFNYLFARHHGGTFILRIEDTDQTRYVPGAEEYILESLRWCGIEPDEGVGKDGPYGPYRQSDRKTLYGSYAAELIEKGRAYYAFDTPEELERLRSEAEAKGETFTYNAESRGTLNNSLNMSPAEVVGRISNGLPYVVRFKFEPEEVIGVSDLIRGAVSFQASTLDDKILYKSDGMPTYHLANVVDDHLMEITHVIRGEEWLPSLPLHVAMYRAFGWDSTMPHFAHLPLILKPTGKGKLSKRDGDKGGFPVFPLEWKDPESGEISSGYREAGYFPEACLNILAFLGWNPGTEQEIFTLEELAGAFTLEKVGKSGSKFDPEKARWYNHQYLQMKTPAELAAQFAPELRNRGFKPENEKLEKIISLVRERVSFVGELWEQSSFFFEAPVEYDPQVVKKRWKENTPAIMQELMELLSGISPFNPETMEPLVKAAIEARGWGMGDVMNAWRLALVGTSRGPGLFDLAAILGKEEVIARMKSAVERLA
ncbi:MAG: glutamate--tRNA ligase [Bacteroidota bacterium]